MNSRDCVYSENEQKEGKITFFAFYRANSKKIPIFAVT